MHVALILGAVSIFGLSATTGLWLSSAPPEARMVVAFLLGMLAGLTGAIGVTEWRDR